MRTTLIASIFAIANLSNAMAQELIETDLSRYELLEEGETVVTLSELEEMEDAYKALMTAGDCDAAIPSINEFADAANHVSNLIRQGNEPYYSARRDDQEDMSNNRSLVNELVAAERTFNNLLRKRNEAWVEEAKCLLATGDKRAAVNRLFRALDYISGTEEAVLWKEARTLLWSEVGLETGN